MNQRHVVKKRIWNEKNLIIHVKAVIMHLSKEMMVEILTICSFILLVVEALRAATMRSNADIVITRGNN